MTLRFWQLCIVGMALSMAAPHLQAWQGPVPVQGPASAQSPPISLEILPPQAVIPAGSPVNVKAITRNISNSDIEVDVGRAFTADATDDAGHAPPDTVFRRIFEYNFRGSPNNADHLTGSGGNAHLRPGESWTDTVDLNTLYDFSRPGVYTVQLRRMWYGAWIRSNSVVFTVAPVAGSGAASTPQAASATPPFQLTIKARGDVVPLASPIGLLVVTKNVSQSNILLWTEKAEGEQGGSAYRINVQNIAGNAVTSTDLGRQAKSRTDVPTDANPDAFSGPGGERLMLQPGEDWEDSITLNKLYDFKAPGQYTVQVERFDPATKSMVKSNVITVTVTR